MGPPAEGACSQAGLELEILLSSSFLCWDYRRVLPCSVFTDSWGSGGGLGEGGPDSALCPLSSVLPLGNHHSFHGALKFLGMNVKSLLILYLRMTKRGWGVAQWKSSCLACTRPWV